MKGVGDFSSYDLPSDGPAKISAPQTSEVRSEVQQIFPIYQQVKPYTVYGMYGEASQHGKIAANQGIGIAELRLRAALGRPPPVTTWSLVRMWP